MYKEKVEAIKREIYSLMPNMAPDDVFYELQNSLLSEQMVHMMGILLGKHLNLKFIGSGVSRATYLLDDNTVIKLFIGADETDNYQHDHEIKNLIYANEHNIQYAPKLYYYDEYCIIMEYIPNPYQASYCQPITDAITSLKLEGFDTDYDDIHYCQNWRYKDDINQPYLIDWGTTLLKEEIKSF